MIQQAAERGANGIVAIRYDANKILPGITEVVAYGLAVSDQRDPANSTDAAESPAADGIRRYMVSTTNEVPGYGMQVSMGIVQGLTVRSRNIFAGIGAGFKSIVGGEITTWTTMCDDAREEAYKRMLAEASARGADGIIAMRYDTNELNNGVTEVLAYGTAMSSPSSAPATGASTLAQSTGIERQVTTANSLPGGSLPHSLGIVRGITVRSSSFIGGFAAGLKNIVGGEIKTWSSLCENARQEALSRMLEQAAQVGAQGIVAMRYDTNELQPGVTEVIAYGTAVSKEAPGDEPPSGIARHRICTSNELPGCEAQSALGPVRGVSVRSCNLLRSVGAGLKTIVGGEIRNWTKLCEDAREEAFSRMLAQAIEIGATGITAMRYDTNDLAPGVIEVLCYGTAVVERVPASMSAGNEAPRLSGGASHPLETLSGGLAAELHRARAGLGRSFVSTSTEILGCHMQRSLGLVRGITVRSRSIGANIGAGLKTLVGGEIKTWTKVCEDAREEAFKRLLEEAEKRGAKAVVALRYETNELDASVTEVLAYGTAVSE
mmetsp:Transcript_65857/g.140906  ORF Transcript_65857/g.140906 Transcript_65857/m.140906 type:complete len:548 (+) Transcript_65857:285-1928(+)